MFITYICIYMCAKKFFIIKNKKILYNIIFYTGLFIGVLGILQRYVDCVKLAPIFNKGICSTFGHSNFFGSYISIILPIGLSYYILKGNTKFFILSFILFFNMIASGTRSAWVALCIVVFFIILFLIKQRNKEYYKRFLIALIAFLLVFIYVYNGVRITHIFNRNTNVTNTSLQTTKKKVEKVKSEIKIAQTQGINKKMGSSRIWIWIMTIDLIKQKPIIGCGTDNLKNGLLEYTSDEFMSFYHERNEIIDKAHNEYLQIAATTGIPSLIIYLIFVTSILAPKMKNILSNEISFVFSIIIISYLVQAFFNISTIGVAPLFWMILGFSDNKKLLEVLDSKINEN